MQRIYTLTINSHDVALNLCNLLHNLELMLNKAYLASVSCTFSGSLAVENVLWCTAVNGMTCEIGSEPTSSTVVEEALGDLKAFPFIAWVALIRQFCIQVVIHLKSSRFQLT